MELSEEALKARREYARNWREKNKEHVRKYHKKWRSENKDKVARNQKNFWERKAFKKESQVVKSD